ncbi:hypothetical protein [Sphingomonas japonica]|uniref:hypothetical protein n=1 Tax=Sphingomonas japonica TaxID=511662 RepID=UPI001ABB0C5F|nr:hypothetical protein [Sphingomonas japonica]
MRNEICATTDAKPFRLALAYALVGIVAAKFAGVHEEQDQDDRRCRCKADDEDQSAVHAGVRS